MIDHLVYKYAGCICKKPRARYSEQEKAVIRAMLIDARGNCRVVVEACKIGWICSLQLSAVQKIHNCAKMLRGRPVNKDFEQLVLSLALSEASLRTVRTNVPLCLAMLQRVASDVLTSFPEYLECPIVQRLKFSFKWASGILKRHFLIWMTHRLQVGTRPNRRRLTSISSSIKMVSWHSFTCALIRVIHCSHRRVRVVALYTARLRAPQPRHRADHRRADAGRGAGNQPPKYPCTTDSPPSASRRTALLAVPRLFFMRAYANVRCCAPPTRCCCCCFLYPSPLPLA